jgi:hypothetical protein
MRLHSLLAGQPRDAMVGMQDVQHPGQVEAVGGSASACR